MFKLKSIMVTEKEIKAFLEQAHRYGNEKFMPCSSGNLSWRVGNQVIISGTGSWVSKLEESKVAVLDLDSGVSQNGVKPSMENGFHLGVLRNRPDCNVVFHFQSEYVTSVACMKNRPVNFNMIAEVPCHVGTEMPLVPYYRPGSKELADGVTEALINHNSVMLINHGVVVCAKDFDEAFEIATFFELACKIIIHTQGQYNTLTDQDVSDLEVYVLGKQPSNE